MAYSSSPIFSEPSIIFCLPHIVGCEHPSLEPVLVKQRSQNRSNVTHLHRVHSVTELFPVTVITLLEILKLGNEFSEGGSNCQRGCSVVGNLSRCLLCRKRLNERLQPLSGSCQLFLQRTDIID